MGNICKAVPDSWTITIHMLKQSVGLQLPGGMTKQKNGRLAAIIYFIIRYTVAVSGKPCLTARLLLTTECIFSWRDQIQNGWLAVIIDFNNIKLIIRKTVPDSQTITIKQNVWLKREIYALKNLNSINYKITGLRPLLTLISIRWHMIHIFKCDIRT